MRSALPPIWCCLRSSVSALLAAMLLLSALPASAITYSNLNLTLVFTTDGGANEMVVDLGPASGFYNAAPGSSFPISRLSANSLSAAFSGVDGLIWSVSGSVVGANGTAQRPAKTVWATRPRTDLALASTAWSRSSSLSMGGVANKCENIGLNARAYGETFGGASNGVSNSGTTLILPAGHSLAPSVQLGSGNFGGSWQDSIVNVVPNGFVAAKAVSRSDLYEVNPSPPSGPGTYLGYFQLKWDGTMTFTAATPAPGIIQVSPSSGPAAGATLVTLTGFNFVSGTVVSFGSVTSSTVSVVSPSSITAVSPAGSAGSVDVTVTNPDGQFARVANGFTYQAGTVQPPAPRILSITISGTDTVIRSAGATNGSLRVLSSVTVGAPIGNWTPVATNVVGLNGLSTNRLPIVPGPGPRFYRLAIP